MNIAVGSAFRNSAHRVQCYLQQVVALKQQAELNHSSVRAIAVEGDSRDGTQCQLLKRSQDLGIDLEIVEVSHGGPEYGSTEQPERMRQLSGVGNAILDGVRGSDDILVYVESDLIWDSRIIWALCQMVESSPDWDSISPLIFAGEHFYDVWGFRGIDGERFAPFPPYHRQLHPTNITEVSSVGSCLVMKAALARTVRMTSGALVEFCANARVAGFKFGVAPTLRIQHPA